MQEPEILSSLLQMCGLHLKSIKSWDHNILLLYRDYFIEVFL